MLTYTLLELARISTPPSLLSTFLPGCFTGAVELRLLGIGETTLARVGSVAAGAPSVGVGAIARSVCVVAAPCAAAVLRWHHRLYTLLHVSAVLGHFDLAATCLPTAKNQIQIEPGVILQAESWKLFILPVKISERETRQTYSRIWIHVSGEQDPTAPITCSE